MKGYPDNTFRPDDFLTREQMAAIIMRFIGFFGIVPTRIPDPPQYFNDDAEISSWAKNNVAEMRLIGLVKGKDGGRFDPLGDLTRAEAATVIMRFCEMNDLLALGEPETLNFNRGNFALMGAWDLYYGGGSLDASGSGVSVEEDGAIPCIRSTDGGDKFLLGLSGDRTQDGNTSFGKAEKMNPLLKDNWFEINMSVANIDSLAFPVVRFGYKTTDGEPLSFGLFSDYYGFAVNDWEATEYVPFEEIEDRVDGIRYGIVDLSRFASAYATSFSFCPSLMSEGEISLYYFAAFRTVGEAEEFDVREYAEEFSSFRGEVIPVETATPDDVRAVRAEARAKADAILNRSEDIDPATIRGNCYYVSNRGDDKNSGTSPDSPWRSFVNLYRVVKTVDGDLVISNLRRGDALFLERGSVFDRGRYGEYDCLLLSEGVTYAAYGEGEKPVITCRFITDEPAGRWSATEYENVWKFDYEIHDYPGNIVFVKEDGTELCGVCVFLDDYRDPYSGAESRYYGVVSNGEESFESGGVPFTDPGSLRHNLEYFCDVNKGELYVRFDRGNPGEVFREIDVATDQMAIDDIGEVWSNDVTRIDNLSIRHAGVCGINTWEADDLFITGCDFAWIGGAFQNEITRYGNAVSNWGACDGVFVNDCYFRDVYDAAVSTQGTWGSMRNYYSSGCVLERCCLNYEFFNNGNDPDGKTESELTNVFISGNYVVDSGYGFCSIRPDRRGAFFIPAYSYYNTRYNNVVYENNVNVFSSEYALFGSMYAAGKTRGAIVRNNVYYLDTDEAYYAVLTYDPVAWSGHSATLFPMTSQYMTYFSSVGIDRGSRFFSAKR